jgi:arylsulfatase A-like enzyme
MVPGWGFDRILPALVEESVAFLRQRATARGPFFLYCALTSPHFPVVPSRTFKGATGHGDLADFIVETDAAVGRLVAALDEHGLAENTIFIFTSDNGPALNSRTPLNRAGHRGAGLLRGWKGSVYEGGHRVPFIVRWPRRTPAGATTAEPICQTALLATVAEMLGAVLPARAGEDSFSIWHLLLGRPPSAATHPVLVSDSGEPVFAVREGRWKLILMPDGRDELYDLSADPGETANRLADHPEIAARLSRSLAALVAAGRSTPGIAQENDAPVVLRHPGTVRIVAGRDPSPVKIWRPPGVMVDGWPSSAAP